MATHRVYKYRSLEPWEFLLDIFVNERLYAAQYKNLNDPMEGIFTYSNNENPHFIQQLSEQKTQLKICSLSKVHNSTLMWSYYASAHKGVVLEIEIDDSIPEIGHVETIDYVQENIFEGFYGSDPLTEARKILSKKFLAWEHEEEIRIFSSSEFVPVSILKIYLGCQMPETQAILIEKLARKVNPNVLVEKIQIDDLDSQL